MMVLFFLFGGMNMNFTQVLVALLVVFLFAFLFTTVAATAIATVAAMTAGEVEAIYTIGGAKVQSLQKGVNILKMKNGQTRKVFVK